MMLWMMLVLIGAGSTLGGAIIWARDQGQGAAVSYLLATVVGVTSGSMLMVMWLRVGKEVANRIGKHPEVVQDRRVAFLYLLVMASVPLAAMFGFWLSGRVARIF